MDNITNIKLALGITFGAIVGFLGGFDLALKILFIAIGLDILTGILKAIYMQKLSSQKAYKGGIKKIGIFIIVALACAIDDYVGVHMVRNCTIGYYVANEGMSILENWGQMELPLPRVLKATLEQLQEDNNKNMNEAR